MFDIFDNVYLVNLDSRPDRLESATTELNRYNIGFERFPAVNGYERQDIRMIPAFMIGQPECYWNRGALGMCLSLIGIIEDAQKRNLNSILILEDDIEFREDLPSIYKYIIENIPTEYESLFFGLNSRSQVKYNDRWDLIKSGYALHCHALHHSVFQYMIDNLSGLNNPADVVYDIKLFSRGKSFVCNPKIAYQRASHSSITNTYADYQFLRN